MCIYIYIYTYIHITTNNTYNNDNDSYIILPFCPLRLRIGHVVLCAGLVSYVHVFLEGTTISIP